MKNTRRLSLNVTSVVPLVANTVLVAGIGATRITRP